MKIKYILAGILFILPITTASPLIDSDPAVSFYRLLKSNHRNNRYSDTHLFNTTAAFMDAIKKYRIPYEIAKQVVFEESRGYLRARSAKDAKGLMQVQEDTKDHYEWVTKKKIKSIWWPSENVEVGCWYLSLCKKCTGSWDSALIAYNIGLNAWKRYQFGRGYAKRVLQEG